MTKEKAKQASEIMLAYSEGKTIQWKSLKSYSQDWRDIEQICLAWAWHVEDYRIKPEPPKPVYRPWTAEEVPLGAWMRNKQRGLDSYKALIVEVHDGKLIYGTGYGTNIYYTDLHKFEHSTDNGKSWHPCGVLVTHDKEL